MLDKKEIAEELKISVVTVDRLREKGLPCYKVGKRVLFEKEEVLKFIRGMKE